MAPHVTPTTREFIISRSIFYKTRLIAMISNATITRRFVGLSALGMYAFAHYPLADPTSNYSLSLAQGVDSVPLERDDQFAVNVRAIATRVGVKNAENLSIRIGDDTSGASLGSNFTIRARGACVVLPRELYEAFYATPALRQQYKQEIPTKDEINFVLAHESAHIARNHSIISGTFLPVSVIASCYAIRRIPNKLIASAVGCLGLLGANLLLSWRLEHEADHIAAEAGFGTGGIHCFQRKLSRNCELRTLLNTRMITKEGNYLGDTSHPLLTSRIEHLKMVASSEFSRSNSSHSCRYCMK